MASVSTLYSQQMVASDALRGGAQAGFEGICTVHKKDGWHQRLRFPVFSEPGGVIPEYQILRHAPRLTRHSNSALEGMTVARGNVQRRSKDG
jgi:hypothetical protein